MNQVQQRLSRGRQDQIVAAAREIAAAEGWGAVTVRRIAAAIGCSAPAIYQYFRDKDAILTALADEAEAALLARLTAAVEEIGGPAKRLRACARALWDFAFDRPELYAVLTGVEGAAPRSLAGGALAVVWQQTAASVVEKRELDTRPEDLTDQVVGLLHGFIAMTRAGLFAGGPQRGQVLMSNALDAMLRGLGK